MTTFLPSQAERYHRDGFIALEGVFSSPATESLRRAASDIVAGFDIDRHRTVFKTTDRDAGRDEYFFDSAESVHCFLEEDALDAAGRLTRPKSLAINKIGHALHDRVPAFTAFCRQPVIGDALRAIGMETPLLWQTMYIFKPPHIGGEVRWHQDASYLITDPPAVTGMWVALEDATRDNGCLWMAPGGHRRPLREIYEVDWVARKGVLRDLDDTPWPGPAEAVAVEVPAGSLVLFHDHMPHYSSVNRSERSRHAFTMHFADRSARWLEHNWLQRPNLGAFPV